MRIIRGRIDGDKLKLNSKVLGYTGNADAAEIRIDVSPWGKEPHGLSYNLIVLLDTPLTIPMHLNEKRLVAGAKMEKVLDQSGKFAVRLQASRKGRVVHSASTEMQILANPATPEIAISRTGSEISEIALRVPKTAIKDKKRNFVFAHIDSNNRVKSTRLAADHEDSENIYYKFAPVSQSGDDSEATIQFSLESPEDTVWQSQEYLFLSDEIPSESPPRSVAAYVTLDGHFETKEDSADPPVKVYDREMVIPQECVEIAVQGDRNAEIVTFECDRYYDGWDLSNKRWYVEVFNAGDVYDIVSPIYFEVRDSSIISVWLVNARHAEYHGKVQVRLRATDGIGYVWQTHTGVFSVYKTFLQIEPPSEPGLSYFDEQIAKAHDLLEETKVNAGKAETATKHSPYPNEETNTWMIWDADLYGHVDSGAQVTGDQGLGGKTEIVEVKTGEEGSLAIIEETEDSTPENRKYILTLPIGKTGTGLMVLGLYPDVDTLLASHPTGNAGEAYAIGTDADNLIYLWHVDAEEWVNIGKLQGPQGIAGDKGDKGDKGDDGTQGPPGNLLYPTFMINFEDKQLYLITPENYEGMDWRVNPETRQLEWLVTVEPGQIGEQEGVNWTPLGAIILNPRGTYDENAAYAHLDIVLHGANSYVCAKACIGIETDNLEYWKPLTNVPEGIDLSTLAAVAFSGSYNDLKDTPALKAVATSGSYNDLTDTPSIPGVVSDLTNDAGYQTAEQVQGTVTAGLAGYVPVARKVAGKPLSADVDLSKSDVGLAQVDNTSDVAKPVSTATQAALNGKLDKSGGTMGGDLVSNNPALATSAVRNIIITPNDLEAGTTPLTPGAIVAVYE